MTLRGRTEVHIERLTLRGVALRADESELLRRVMEAEITARLKAAPVNTAPTRAAAAQSANAPVGWTPGDPAQLGRDLGRVVHERLEP